LISRGKTIIDIEKLSGKKQILKGFEAANTQNILLDRLKKFRYSSDRFIIFDRYLGRSGSRLI
jgi:hypothetical protein